MLLHHYEPVHGTYTRIAKEERDKGDETFRDSYGLCTKRTTNDEVEYLVFEERLKLRLRIATSEKMGD
ncbi:hypothetical protein Tco_0475625 [Tanacetum coccineum]